MSAGILRADFFESEYRLDGAEDDGVFITLQEASDGRDCGRDVGDSQ